MNSIRIDLNKEKKRELLRLMSIGLLDREKAIELKNLLLQEVPHVRDNNHRQRLSKLILILDKYITGKVNLMSEPNPKVANYP